MSDLKKGFCLSCNKLLRGRSDKKYCDKDCRNEYNNERNRLLNLKIASTNRILKRNRAILSNFQSMGKVTLSRETLVNEGFNFTYFTNSSKKGELQLFYCYDQVYHQCEHSGYRILDPDQVPGIPFGRYQDE